MVFGPIFSSESVLMRVWSRPRRHRGNTFFDVTVTGQWSSPSGCLVLPMSSMKVSVFCVVLRWKISLIRLVFCEFDPLKWVFKSGCL